LTLFRNHFTTMEALSRAGQGVSAVPMLYYNISGGLRGQPCSVRVPTQFKACVWFTQRYAYRAIIVDWAHLASLSFPGWQRCRVRIVML